MGEPSPQRSGPQLAAIDLGSNSFRLEIGQVQAGRYRRIDYLKETVRLGAGLDANGFLTEEAAERGMTCLRGFAARLAGFDPGHVRAVATQTLREARNRDAFLASGQSALGLPIEVISGREEARLIYGGVSRLQPSDDRRLVVDIGGRSTELILGEGFKVLAAESFAVGCVSLSMRFFESGRFTRPAFEAAQLAAEAELEDALQTFEPGSWSSALGSSGTAGAVSELLEAAQVTDGRITLEALAWCREQCIEAGRADRLRLPGLKGDRAAVIGGGIAILAAVMSTFELRALVRAKGALRQGVIFELAERLAAPLQHDGGDMRDASIADLQARFKADVGQAAQVRRVALALWDMLHPRGADERRLELAWACELHEIGLMVSHHDHHRHSSYLIAHADVPGFSQSQQRRLGELLLGQRGGLRKMESAFAREAAADQLLCLRLALIECHARGPVRHPALQLSREGTHATVSAPAGWAREHPRTAFLLQEESENWRRSGPLTLRLRI
jgi:exopolyphosphatase/guanosine-5'-triphosphate,3'-diphosphate pyrophosphatase